MCGIVGFSGRTEAMPVLLDTLTFLEYRGYDSSGVAFFDFDRIRMIKAQGRLNNLKTKLSGESINSTCGIGHTRWATHGSPTEKNAHPHGTQRVAIVHNGIIENSESIKQFLLSNGYNFLSDTDTEVCAKLIDYYYARVLNPIQAINMVAQRISGSYAICALFREFEGRIYAFRKDNPLIITSGSYGNFICSDISAVPDSAGEYYTVEECEVAEVCSDGIGFFGADMQRIDKNPHKLRVEQQRADKDGYAHFMLKEIFEEPEAVRRTVSSLMFGGGIDLGIDADEKYLKCASGLHIVACGTAYNAGMCAKYVIEELARIPVQVHLASEFLYTEPVINDGELVFFVSQSGETADTLSAMRLVKSMGIRTFAVVNSHGSAMALEADDVIYTHAGREISVASTKAYCVQLAAMYMVALKLANARGIITSKKANEYASILLNEVPGKISEVFTLEDVCKTVAEEVKNAKSIFYIGRGADYAQSMEGALKTKEISYIHCEAYAAGELKHGSIALIEEGTPVIAIMTKHRTKEKIINNIREVNARGANVILLASQSMDTDTRLAHKIIKIPDTEEIFMPVVCAAVLQLIAYYTSVGRGLDADKPRNLAKSVTVE